MRFGSLFSGIGGFDLGFERAGHECAWQVEIDDYATKVLEKHWPNIRRWRDVRTFPPGPGWEVDCIIGGDPCQANSAAAGPVASRSTSLGDEFLRIVAALRPRIVVRENPSHTKIDAPWPWWRFRAGLESLGYVVLPFRLRACCVGLDHERDRLFLLATNSHTYGERLEGWNKEKTPAIESCAVPALVGPANGMDIRGARGFGSRAGLPDYVDRVRCLGNAVVPQVAEWIGRHLIYA